MEKSKVENLDFIDEEQFDEDIRDAIHDFDPNWLRRNLNISLEKASEICEEVRLRGKISLRNLKLIMFARDRNVLDVSIDKVTNVNLASENLEKEFEFFNNDMLDKNDSAVKVEGKNWEGKRVVIYYYPGSIISDEFEIFRQMRTYNENGDVESVESQMVFADGTMGTNIAGLAAYKYDENGNKKFGIYQDEVYGGRYFEYDEDGKMSYLLVERDYRNLSTDMQTRLVKAFAAKKADFMYLDNSVLEDKLYLFSGEMYKSVEDDKRVYDER